MERVLIFAICCLMCIFGVFTDSNWVAGFFAFLGMLVLDANIVVLKK